MSRDMISVDIKGYEKATDLQWAELTGRTMPMAMERIGSVMTDLAQTRIHNVTGRLSASLVHETGREGDVFSVTVGTNVFYGPYVEYGTGRRGAGSEDGPSYKGHPSGAEYNLKVEGHRAYPYLRPALYDETEVYDAIIDAAVREALQ